MASLQYTRYQNAVKRINEKLIQAEKTFGKGSAVATKIKHDIATLIPKDALYYNAKGQIQISRSKALFDKYGTDYLSKAERVETAQDYLTKSKRSQVNFSQEWFGGISKEKIVKRSELMQKLEDFSRNILPNISGMKDERSQRALEILQRKGRRTYDDMEQIINIMEG